MPTENFDAIGRYVSAKERAESLRNERQKPLAKLSGLASDALKRGRDGEVYSKFDSEQAAALLERIKELDAQMMAAVDEANQVATAAGKPALKKV